MTRFRSTKVEIAKLRRRLAEAMTREQNIVPNDLELRADHASYLCIRVAGYLEQSTAEILRAHFRERSDGFIRSYGESNLDRVGNLTTHTFEKVLGQFDLDLMRSFSVFMQEKERGSSLNALIGTRNNIAHGESTGISHQRVSEYFVTVEEIITWLLQKFNSS